MKPSVLYLSTDFFNHTLNWKDEIHIRKNVFLQAMWWLDSLTKNDNFLWCGENLKEILNVIVGKTMLLIFVSSHIYKSQIFGS